MSQKEVKQVKDYCKRCGEVLVYEPSIYFENCINRICYLCKKIYLKEYIPEMIEERTDKGEIVKKQPKSRIELCAEYWNLICPTYSVSSAVIKRQRRNKSIRF